MTECSFCGIPLDQTEDDHEKKCRENAKDPDEPIPNPECDHDLEVTGGIKGERTVNGRPEPMTVTYKECRKCGGVFSK